MEFHIRRRANFLNSELEALRDKILRESAQHHNDWIEDMINKTSKIHAGFLFHDKKTLQDLCLFIGESQNKITDPGWEAFGCHLGLNPSLLKVINFNNFNKEDPTYNVLLAFVQHEDATLGKIIQALKTIGRLDVITRIRKSLNDLVDILLQHSSNDNLCTNDVNDCASLQLLEDINNICSRLDSESLHGDGTTNSLQFISSKDQMAILRPRNIPPAPFIFQNLKKDPGLIIQHIQNSSNNEDLPVSTLQSGNHIGVNVTKMDVEGIKYDKISRFERIQTSLRGSIKAREKSPNNRKKYEKIVMLTFAPDGEKHAEEVCKILRKKRENFAKIGVLVLSEHISEVQKDPITFITGCFHQVDYVCPILSENYFNLIRRNESPVNMSDLQLDAQYVQFIYSLMNNYYISNKCLNDKIRCIIPDDFVIRARYNFLMSIPIFKAWVKLSEIEEFAGRLLKSKS